MQAVASAGERHHPRGLYALFFTEMWERFCYYGMRALLVLYLIQYHGWQPGQASTIYKWYTSLVYLTPLAGGLLADRVLGLRLATWVPIAEEIPGAVAGLAAARAAARQSRQWAEADRLRAEILAAGWEMEDRADGYGLKRVNPSERT